MSISDLLADKALKGKEKTAILSTWLIDKKISTDDLIAFVAAAKDPVKAICIEALEYATRQEPAIGTRESFRLVTQSLSAKAPRVKWESAKVIGNTAHLHADELDGAIEGLLQNSEHEGTVVRWSAAFALGEILKLRTKHNTDLLPALEAICRREEKNSIRKIYLDAIKKATK
jgi:HEAT repeat protein